MSERFLAKGVEKKVYEDPSNPERVIKIYNYESSSLPEVKALYHFGKLLHILFPDNIPDTFQVGQRDGETKTIVGEKRYRDADHQRVNELLGMPGPLTDAELAEYKEISDRQQSINLGSEITHKLEGLNIKFDSLQRNFSRQENGHDVYLDTINPWRFIRPTDAEGLPDLNQKKFLVLNFDEAMMVSTIESLPDEQQKRLAYMHLDRIKTLAEQEQTEMNSSAWGPF